MNSKKLCCICVLFSLLAGCASESSIDEKKKKAQVTQSNINKNTPQQLTDKDLFGNETTLAVSEEDIQAALDGDEGNDSNLLIVFYVQIMPDDFVMQLHRF